MLIPQFDPEEDPGRVDNSGSGSIWPKILETNIILIPKNVPIFPSIFNIFVRKFGFFSRLRREPLDNAYSIKKRYYVP